jgi:cathepsin L
MKTVIVLLALVALAACATNYEGLFSHFTSKYGKTYSHEEFQHRFLVFKRNVAYIEAHNKKNLSFTLGINQFADLHVTEFNQIYKGLLQTDVVLSTEKVSVNPDAPSSIDWRKKNAVTGVKNQQQCGSCWSFSTTGSVEGSRAIATGKLISLSEQQLVDCSGSYGNQGCNGGLMDNAFQYIIANGGLDTEASYPYTAEDGTCSYSQANCATDITSYKDVASGDENDLLNSVVIGPVSVAIDASQNSFQLYSSGVYYEPACSSTQLDHGVLAVGYDQTNSGTKYWIVKNSWGTDWGQNGYIWMSRDRNNNCGIATAASYPIGGEACPKK